MTRTASRAGTDRLRSHRQLHVYQTAVKAAMRIFEITKTFPREEQYSLTDQARRSSRSVCANIAEAWRKRRYSGAFVSKLNDAEAEAAETQVWVEFSVRCGYVDRESGKQLHDRYDEVLAKLVTMTHQARKWIIGSG
ncbi:MAG: four helix bundle protein [Acidobacteria bacterium]|nr:four helix bundle protein [Acidobacteriota bacterium]